MLGFFALALNLGVAQVEGRAVAVKVGEVVGVDGLAAAARVRCPTLLICGELDRMTPADAVKPLSDSLEKAGCSARIIVLAGAGHAMMQEAPHALVDALRGPN